MKSLLTILLISLAGFANAQTPEFCVKNDTHSNNYQFRIEYTCPTDGKNTTQWTNWYKMGEGPDIGTCIPNTDLACKTDWVPLTLEVRTGNSANTASLKAPEGNTISKITLIDPLNDNAVGTISWDIITAARIF
jgi:hypothetical protein